MSAIEQAGGRGRATGRGSGCNSSRSNRNNNNNNGGRHKKGATEELGYHIFDCASRKDIKACTETIKQIAIYVGKEFGKYADLIKYVVEKEEDPDLEEPQDIPSNEQ